MILRLALGSLAARALTVAMTVLAIALSVALFLGVEKVRTGAKSSFADTISGTDLIVGARSGSVQLLLYSVFRIGNATNNVTWQSYLDIAARPEVDWIVPISLGDSHRQFRVMGTSTANSLSTTGTARIAKPRTSHDGVLMDPTCSTRSSAHDVATDAWLQRLAIRLSSAHGIASFTDRMRISRFGYPAFWTRRERR